MKVCVLASGSKGNVTYIASSSIKLLIDLGPSCAYVENKLKEIEVNPQDITSILITHTHADHTGGLRVFIKKYHPHIYLTKKMYSDLMHVIPSEQCVFIDGDFTIEDIDVKVIKTSHDTSDSNGYIFEQQEKSVVYITDTGYINIKNHKHLQNRSIYIMESNHDIEMLMHGKYPYYLKQRIMSDRGHLSNESSANYLSDFVGNQTRCVILAHLSEDNNTEELARQTLVTTLKNHSKKIDHIIIANQKERTELIEV